MKTLHNRLILFFTTILLLLAMVFSLYTFLSLRESNDNYVRSNTVSICTSVRYNLEEQISQMNECSLDTVYSLQNTSALQTISTHSYSEISDLHGDQIIDLYDDLFDVMGSNMKVNQINLYMKSGVCIGNGSNTHFTPYDFSKFPYYEEVINRRGSKLMITENTLPSYNDNILLTRCFFNSGDALAGIVEVSQSKKRFFEYIDQLVRTQEQLEIYIFDPLSQSLVYPYDRSIISELGELYIDCFYRNSLENPSYTNLSVKNPQNGKEYMLFHYPLQSYDWNVILVQPKTIVNAPFYEQIAEFSVIFLGVLLFIAFAYNQITGLILKPLNILKSNVEKISMDSILSGDHDFNPNPNIKTQEIALLNSAFEKMYADLKDSATKMLAMKQRENEANYQALHALADPHFIFNSLATISAMAEENRNDDLIRMSNSLCEILRYSTSRQKGTVTFKEELRIAEKYLSCIRIRYGSDMEYRIDIPPDLMELPIPKLSVQMLAENCVKHGFQIEPPFRILVKGGISDGCWFLEVSDNGVGFAPETLQSIREKLRAARGEFHIEEVGVSGSGLVNIFIRLKLMDESSFLELENIPSGGCRVRFGGSCKEDD